MIDITSKLLKEAARLHEKGYSVTPFAVRNGDKKPVVKQWQETRLTMTEVADYLTNNYYVNAIGVVTGSISNNLHLIDIDSKYEHGIEVVLTKEILHYYPDIYAKFRIVTTPSGGLHWYYRLDFTPPGSTKIAMREATEEELKAHPKIKKYAFIETRGEGGGAVTYPSEGYKLVQNKEPGLLTREEHESLMAWLRTFNRIIEVKVERVANKREVSNAYDINPFQAFNENVDPDELAGLLGFKYYQGHGDGHRTIHYTRQGKKSGTSLIFNKESRTFWSFTNNSDLNEGECYTPANILITHLHGGDAKAAYRDLVARGYGKYKPEHEKRLIERVVHGKIEAPSNLSLESKDEIFRKKSELDERCQFGIFWAETNKGVVIDRERMFYVAQMKGYHLYMGDLIRVQYGLIHRSTTMDFYNDLKEYIYAEDDYLHNDICNAYELFIERHGKFVISRLPEIDRSLILRDTRTKSYKHYKNGTVIITAFDLTFVESVEGLIWKHSIKDREFYQVPTYGIYYDYLSKAVGISDYLKRFIGHLCHEYKDATIGYISILSEVVNDAKLGGGSGKNLFFNLLGESTTVMTRPGEGAKIDETLLQSWKGENIFVLSDPEKSFPISKLKDYATNDGLVKYLYKNATIVRLEDMPKLGVATNFTFDIRDGGLKRRLRFLEFTDYFTLKGGVDAEYGMLFPSGWSEEDWAGFDCFIGECIQMWLKAGCKLEICDLSESGWEKQFEQTYGMLYEFISSHIRGWISDGLVANDRFKSQLLHFYEETNTPRNYQASMQKINKALEAYCEHYGYEYESDVNMSFGKGRRFASFSPNNLTNINE